MSHSDCTCAVLRQASRFVTRAYDEALAPVGIGLNQYAILARLRKVDALVLQDLARRLVMDRSTLGHLLRPLERRGFVAIAADATDARRRMVSLTPAGEALMVEAKPLWNAVQARLDGAFGDTHSRDLRDLLQTLLAIPPATLTGAGAARPNSPDGD